MMCTIGIVHAAMATLAVEGPAVLEGRLILEVNNKSLSHHGYTGFIEGDIIECEASALAVHVGVNLANMTGLGNLNLGDFLGTIQCSHLKGNALGIARESYMVCEFNLSKVEASFLGHSLRSHRVDFIAGGILEDDVSAPVLCTLGREDGLTCLVLHDEGVVLLAIVSIDTEVEINNPLFCLEVLGCCNRVVSIHRTVLREECLMMCTIGIVHAAMATFSFEDPAVFERCFIFEINN